jgi:hypothetical protein
MSALAFSTADHACKRPNVAGMDHKAGSDTLDLRPMVKRMCLTCGTHWFGDAHQAVFEMPPRVWDRWIESAWEWQA